MPLLEDWADSTLASLSEDINVPLLDRAYARYELAYRKAFGLRYVLHPENGSVVVLELADTERTQVQIADLKQAEARVKERASARRTR